MTQPSKQAQEAMIFQAVLTTNLAISLVDVASQHNPSQSQ
jgi:hypothetical protein